MWLRDQSNEVLQNLIQQYFVRHHDGRPISHEDPIIGIIEWLSPDETLPPTPIDLSLFKDRIPLTQTFLQDLITWPMRPAWPRGVSTQFSPEQLVREYVLSSNRLEEFTKITGAPADRFLNHTERIFYLTRGYGRPNRRISPNDLKKREIYLAADSTAITALADRVFVCPINPNPDLIRERLSGLDLTTIDRFHELVVRKTTNCLGKQQLCTGSTLKDCDQGPVECFQDLLRSIGASTTIQYRSKSNSFDSNLSQLELYRSVIPDKRWGLDEVIDQPNVTVRAILRQLPDSELIHILGKELPLRGNMLRIIEQNLTRHRYQVEGDRVHYGRSIDQAAESWPIAEFVRQSDISEALIDPAGRCYSSEQAEELGLTELRPWVYKTKIMLIDNQKLIHRLPDKLSLAEECQRRLANELLTGKGLPGLIIWGKSMDESWFPVALKLIQVEDNPELIRSSLEYYAQTLTFKNGSSAGSPS